MSSQCFKAHQNASSLPNAYFAEGKAEYYWKAFILNAQGNKTLAEKIMKSINNDELINSMIDWSEKPFSLEDICNKYFILQYAYNPQSLSKLRIFESLGVKEHNAYLNNVSPTHILELHTKQKNTLALLKDYNLSDKKSLDYSFLEWIQQDLNEKTPFIFHEYRVTQMFGILQDLVSVFTKDHILDDEGDAVLYLLRLQKVPMQIEQTIELMEYQKKLKIVPPEFTIKKVINLLKNLMPSAIKDNILYTHFENKLKEIRVKNINEYQDKAFSILMSDIYPALQLLKKYCTKLISLSHMNGVWALPNGDAYYRYCLKKHTTTNLSADEIHILGCKNVHEITGAIKQILLGLGESVTDENVVTKLSTIMKELRFQYQHTIQEREQCLGDLREISRRSCLRLYPFFSIKPKKRVKIEAVPKELEEGAPLAYYTGSSIDGKRDGIFYINLRDMSEISKCQLESLVLHEAEPGHHFQRTLQQELDFSIIRKYVNFNAYCEGWGLYCERLGYEQKFYSDVYQELGYLQWELLRSARLVVDTGIHHKRWSYEEAIEYMIKVTGLEKAKVITEVERYFVMPGQACSYKIGQHKLLELRDKEKKLLKDDFNIQNFHDKVLRLGSMPLSLLEKALLKD